MTEHATTATAGPRLEITRIFDAPREAVWAAWTEPEQVASWSGPRGFEITSNQADLRAGGAWRMCMRSAEWGELWQHGVFRQVDRPELLVFTTAWEEPDGTPEHEMLVTIRFADLGGKTEMMFQQSSFRSEQSRDSHIDGWTQCLDKLGEHLAAAGEAP